MDFEKLVSFMVFGVLLMSTVSFGIGSVDGSKSYAEESTSSEIEDILEDGLKEKIESKSIDEKLEVMIRLPPYEFKEAEHLSTPLSEIESTEITSRLKDHSERKQRDLVEFLSRNDGRILNEFWIANAVLAEVEVDDLYGLAELDDVRYVHKNFELEIHDSKSAFRSEEVLEPQDHSDDHPAVKRNIDMTHKLYHRFDGPSEEPDELTWGLERINADDAWEEGFEGSDIRVAVSDTGLDIDHPDLEGKLVNLEDDEYYNGGWIEFDDEGNVVENSNPVETCMYFGHGTHVSGTVVGGDASGTNIGVAPGADLMHALALPQGRGTLSQILAGLEWKVEPHDRQGVPLHEKYGGTVEDYRAHVASMSWASQGYYQELEEPVQNLKTAGIVPVAGIGNSGEGTVGSPGSIYETFGIGASDSNDDIADFSSGDIVEDGRNETPEKFVKPDFSAPGVEVKSTVRGGEWGKYSGTSMSTPHVSGTIALMLEAQPELSIDDIYHVLEITADYKEGGDSLPWEEKNTRYGHGIIDAHSSLDMALGNILLHRAENISRYESTLKAEVFQIPDDELEVLFRYRQVGEEEWSETDPMIINESRVFDKDITGLEKNTNYEYKAVEVRDGENQTTISLTFKTHDDVEIFTLDPVNVTDSTGELRSKVTDMYIDNVSVLFRYRPKGEDVWNETEAEPINETGIFKQEIDGLDEVFVCEYKAIVISDESEFNGSVVQFPTSGSKPEWDENDEAYLITNVGELQWIRNELEADYIIENDIDASWTQDWPGDKGFIPIGNETQRFNGTLDGQGYEIKDMYIDRQEEDKIGVFSYIGVDGGVKNTEMRNAAIAGYSDIGVLSGVNHGEINSTSIQSDIVYGNERAGGVIARNYGNLTNTTVEVEMWISNKGGGLVFYNDGMIRDSNVRGNLTGFIEDIEEHLGGLVGSNSGEISNSDFEGFLDGYGGEVDQSTVGGIVGLNEGNITEATSRGTVRGWQSYTGGTIGLNFGNISESNSSSEVISGGRYGGDPVGGLIGINVGDVNYSHATGSVGFNGDLNWVGNSGGLIGINYGDVKHSHATGDVRGSSEVGGLIGRNHGNIYNGFAKGDVIARGNQVGGLIGLNGRQEDYGGEVSRVFSSGDVEITTEYDDIENVGGLIGHSIGEVQSAYSSSDLDLETDEEIRAVGGLIGSIEDPGYLNQSYSVGAVSGDEDIGGLVGISEDGEVKNSYWDMGRSGVYESDGGTGLTTIEMIGAEALDNMDELNFDEIWETVEREDDDVGYDGYPILRAFDREKQIDIQEQEIGTMVTTLRVSEKDLYSAVLRGQFIPMNFTEETEVYFQYRESGDENWMETQPRTLSDIEEFENEIDDLSPGTEYEFRSRAERKDLEVNGETLNFTTEDLPTYELLIDSTEGGEVIEPSEYVPHEYDEGTQVQLEAVPDDDHRFVEWTGDTETIQDVNSNSTTIEMLDDYEITAEFALKEHELEISIEGEGTTIPSI